MKYHCTKRPFQDLSLDDNFFRIMKVINLGKNNINHVGYQWFIKNFIFLGIPLLFYGMAAIALIKHTEIVSMSDGQKIAIYFLYPEDKGSPY